jgi:signal transduction histidine kinase
VDLGVNDTTLRLPIDDDGDGGADPALGSGIIGLIDRVDALGGKLTLRSPLGEGTSLVIELPLEPAGELTAAAARIFTCAAGWGYPPGRFLIRLSVNALRRLAAR